MELRILFIDDEEIRNDLVDYFNNDEINGYTLKAEESGSFEGGLTRIKSEHFDIIVLDLCKGKPADEADKEGLEVLREIQNLTFIPVIFFSGLAYAISDLESQVVGVVNKSDGIPKLKNKITETISSNSALIKSKIHNHIETELKVYFWDIVHENRDLFNKNEFSLGYLLLRRLAHSLSKDNIRNILEDATIKKDKVHPMEFYIFPASSGEYEVGEIVKSEEGLCVLLTPSCDFILRPSKGRKVGKALLAKIIPLVEFNIYNTFKHHSNKENRKKLESLITNNQSDRYFFLPGTPFIDNSIIDFQNKVMLNYDELSTLKRVAKLDDPFCQSMIASFIRYYNRIGFPDIDSDYIIDNL